MNTNDEDLELVVKSMRSYLNRIQGKGTIPDAYISHIELALSTLGTLQQDLKRDICDIDDPELPFPNNEDIEDLDEGLSALWQQSPSLFYSSQYWALHVSQAIQNASVIKRFGIFLEEKALNLIELWSLTGNLLRIQDIVELQRKLEVNWPNNKSIEARLVQSQQWVLETSALHVYTSGLLFLPIGTGLAKVYRKQLEGDLPDILCGFDNYWPHYQTLVGHRESIEYLAISTDGTRIVSGCWHTVLMWDAVTGACIGNGLRVDSVIVYLGFSSDGSHVITVTESRSLMRWYWSSARAGDWGHVTSRPAN
ncbi:hypothetical protein CPB86DRAFT_798584 [Serendipita vermifera]|nr:hypothetical protein CPB86DRAFT_798584 [Serendipita vermifera]